METNLEERGDELNLNVCPTNSFSSSEVGMSKYLRSSREKFPCPQCSYESVKMHNLRRHIRSKHMNDRPFNCDLCSKRFRDNSELRAHLRVHTGEKPFECHICHKRFSRNYQVTRHTKFAHLPGSM